MLAEIGLFFIVVAWILQYYTMKSTRSIMLNMVFVFIYSFGCFILVVDGMLSGNLLAAFFNLAVVVLSLLAGSLTLRR